jgi:hypothetical protein
MSTSRQQKRCYLSPGQRPSPRQENEAAKNKGTELGNFGPTAIFNGLGTIRLSFIQIIVKPFK